MNASNEEGAALDKAGAQCGELRVPLDYSRPGGPGITLAMSRFKATGQRIGVPVMNSGGPGGPSLRMLGEQKISYLGESYGSYLGAVYLQMFPGRTDRVVLDGPVDPGKTHPASCGRSAR